MCGTQFILIEHETMAKELAKAKRAMKETDYLKKRTKSERNGSATELHKQDY